MTTQRQIKTDRAALMPAHGPEQGSHTNGQGRSLAEPPYIRQPEQGMTSASPTLAQPQYGFSSAACADPTEPAPALRDGLYEGGNHELFVELRVDEGVCGVISADLFRVDANGRHYVASIRTAPGSRITLAEGVWLVVGQDEQGQRAAGRLTLNRSDGQAGSLVGGLFFETALQGLPSRRDITFVAERSSDLLRRIGLELELEEDVAPPAPYTFNGHEVTIESALQAAGIDTFTTGLASRIPRHPTGWDTAQLHALMQDFADAALTQRAWELHLLALARSDRAGLLGVMFDTTETLPRQGAAVFLEEIRSIQGIDHDRKVIQTTVHELGHALNLAHRFERVVGRADSTSFMNYDWRYKGGNRRNEFWSHFSFTFDADELEFLRHAPLPPLIPGGEAFHSINYWADGNGGYSPYVPEAPLTGYRISLSPPAGGPVFDFAQPIFLQIELTNQTGRTINLPSFLLDPKAGFLELLIRRRTGETTPGLANARAFVPVVQRCFEWNTADVVSLPPGASLQDNLHLTYGSGGFAFAEPGSYDVTALLVMYDPVFQRDLIARSETLTIRVATPKTNQEEHDALLFFRDDVGLYLTLGGSNALPGAAQALDEIAERRQGKAKRITDPLVANIIRTKGINAGRAYIRFKDGRFERQAPQPAAAADLLQQLDQAALAAFDPATARGTRALADHYRALAET